MTMLPNGPTGRDAHNCSAYDARKVWEMTATLALPEVQSVYGTGEVERTGRTVNEERTYHFIAKSEALAYAAWAEHFGNSIVLVSGPTCKVVCKIDGEIGYARS